MLNIWTEGEKIMLAGRFEHFHRPAAEQFFLNVEDSCLVDLGQLEYISSAGIGVLLAAQKRLRKKGRFLTIVNASNHIRDVFRLAGLSRFFHME